MRSLVSSLLVLLALPGVAGAATVDVRPYPGTDPFDLCSPTAVCPADMLVFTAAAGEFNQLAITEEEAAFPRIRFVVREGTAPVQAGSGCEQIDYRTAACTAGTVGPVRLGDSADRVFATRGHLSGGRGGDVLDVSSGSADGGVGGDFLVAIESEGGPGEDVLMGYEGAGGAGADVLIVSSSGRGDSGDDVLRCSPPGEVSCRLDGGPGDDLLTGGLLSDLLLGGPGDDVLHARAGGGVLSGGRGDDQLVGGVGGDRVDCGADRDHALADRQDRVTRCEGVTRRRA